MRLQERRGAVPGAVPGFGGCGRSGSSVRGILLPNLAPLTSKTGGIRLFPSAVRRQTGQRSVSSGADKVIFRGRPEPREAVGFKLEKETAGAERRHGFDEYLRPKEVDDRG